MQLLLSPWEMSIRWSSGWTPLAVPGSCRAGCIGEGDGGARQSECQPSWPRHITHSCDWQHLTWVAYVGVLSPQLQALLDQTEMLSAPNSATVHTCMYACIKLLFLFQFTAIIVTASSALTQNSKIRNNWLYYWSSCQNSDHARICCSHQLGGGGADSITMVLFWNYRIQ
jgi:hypothetical protein